jgi:hypothetical protein
VVVATVVEMGVDWVVAMGAVTVVVVREVVREEVVTAVVRGEAERAAAKEEVERAAAAKVAVAMVLQTRLQPSPLQLLIQWSHPQQ